MELYERPTLRNVYFLNEMDFKTFKLYPSNCTNDGDRKIKFDNMKSYCSAMINAKGEVKKDYAFTQVTPIEVGGRLYCGKSVQGLPKDIRGLLFRECTTDIDMKNAHPVILRYLCKIHSIACPNLSWYIDHRDEILDEMGKEGKELFLKAVNDDKLNKKISNPFFKNFDKECKSIQQQLTKLDCYSHIVETVPDARIRNIVGSGLNRILCVFENKILQDLHHVCNKNRLEAAAFMFDGLMVYGNLYGNQSLLDEIGAYVNSKFACEAGSLDMIFAYKEHSQLIQVPDEFEIKQNLKREDLLEKRKLENVFISNDNEACDIIFEKLSDTLIFVSDRYYYKHVNCWINNLDMIDALILTTITSSNIYKTNKDFDLIAYAQNTKTAKNIKELLYAKIKVNCSTSIKYSWFHSSCKKKICFEDGVLDFKTKTFTLWEDVKEPIYTTTLIKRPYYNYFVNPNREFIDKIKINIFTNLFGNKTKLALQFFSRAIAGCNEDKNFMSYMGNRDCGKGILYECFTSAFENYVTSFSLDNIMCRRESNKGNDIAKENAWLLDLEFARIAISQETDHNVNGNIKQSLKVSNKVMKSIMSGGDVLEGRRLYEQVTKFTIDTTLAVFGNNELSISEEDSSQHHLKFEGVKQFVTQEKYDSFKQYGDEFVSAYAIRDPDLKFKVRSEDYTNAMVYLLFENYTDTCITVETAINDDEEEITPSIRALIFKFYTITKNDKDRVSKDDLFRLIGKDHKKITAELRDMNCIGSKDCKIGIEFVDEDGVTKKKQIPAFKGLKLKDTDTSM